MADRCAAEARRRVVAQTPQALRAKRKQLDGPRFSVIVPTYNRLPILKKCLAALEMQTLPSNDFEVIVIDDGSSDGTQETLKNYHPSFRFQYLRQTNSGTGAARRNGVAHASGEYLLLMNDDTVCDRDLLEQHLRTQTTYGSQRWAVLGNFEYPSEARRRALTQYFCVEPFMFPQVSMEAGCPYGYSHFITCNLSVRRDAVIEAGSFDSTYKLSEDTELGIRLQEMGYRVLYHPEAHALHDHLPYPARNLIRRARVYGTDYFYMFGRHPRVMKEWAMPVDLIAMDEPNAVRLLHYVETNRREVEGAVEALERWDSVDFEALLADHPDTAATVLTLFRQAVPAIHWFYLFETMLHTMIRELGLHHLAQQSRPMQAAHAAGATS
jgi:glycosyltransferase involved in cell wall biosynthesis